MAQQTINPGSAPVLWSSIDDAFNKINSNFTELYLTISGGSSGAVDLENLASNVSPNTSGAYFLGSSDHRWKALYLTTDGIDIGGALIISPNGSTINLPSGSTVGGELIKNPAESSFKNIAVSGQSTVSADDYTDTVTFAGTDINITTNASTDTVTFVNNGVTQLNGTANEIGVSGTGKGNVTLTNLGVTQLVGTAGQIGVSGTLAGGRGQVTLTNLGVTGIAAGTGISISPVGGTGVVTITNDLPDTFGFRTIAVTGQGSVVAEVREDTLTLTAGTNIFITTVPGTDTITISSTTNFDLKGSVFGDDSSILVDGVNNYIYGNVSATTLRTADTKIALGQGAGGDGLQGLESIAIGFTAGGFTQGDYAVAIGSGAGNIGQGNRAIAIGATAGVDQGDYAISIGNGAGYPSAVSGSIAINASGFTLNAPAAGFFVNPIRNATGANGVVQYDSTTKEVTYSSTLGSVSGTFTGNIFTSLIDSADSSAITVTPSTIFSSDVTVENDLNVTQRLQVQGSRVINLTELKAIVAASADFAALKTAIAALV